MKTKTITIVFLLFTICNLSAQTIEIIKAISDNVLPTAISGVKDLLGTSKNNGNIKTTKKEVESKIEPFKNYAVKIAASTESTARNFKALSLVVNPASMVMDNVGALHALSTDQLISAVTESNNLLVLREFSFQVEASFAEVDNSIEGLTRSVSDLDIDQSLKDRLTEKTDLIRSKFTQIKIEVQNSGVTNVSAQTSPEDLQRYLEYFSRADNQIETLKDNIMGFFSIQKSRTSTFVNESQNLAEEIADKWSEIDFD
ncbi:MULTISPECIES: hypothetical protein [Flavobacteriaceae]|uniref:hypothetical protein n=1 Tax=Flavobacteriaceae TaxID=49546 RepID=UPI001492A0FB|nr:MULTISPECIES: hypothetical protein [Allomuricauda]MDC6364687.1 hypothetical protein [Muricauda sp. AC10]